MTPFDLERVLRLLTAYDITELETADVKIVRPAGVQPPAASLPPIYASPETVVAAPAPGMDAQDPTDLSDLSEDGDEDPRFLLEKIRKANFKDGK